MYIYKIHLFFNMAMLSLCNLVLNHNGLWRHVEIPPKRFYNDHTDKMDEMSMLTLCKLVINHYGWIRGMLKYPKMPLEWLYGQKIKILAKKIKFRLLGKNQNWSKSVKNGSPRAGMHRFVTQI